MVFREIIISLVNTLNKKEIEEEIRIAKNLDQLDLLRGGINGDDDRADSDELQVEEEAAHQHQIAMKTTGQGICKEEWELLEQMNNISCFICISTRLWKTN